MRPALSLLAVATLAAFAACAGSKKDVEVRTGDPEELARLAGTWEGEYQGLDSGRQGPIRFALELGRHTATGEVLMGGGTPLQIEFVSVEKGKVKGTIAPYTDPACQCQVETSFLGGLAADVIDGTFETRVSTTGEVQTGTWRVERQAADGR
jgi:hypothetical protein